MTESKFLGYEWAGWYSVNPNFRRFLPSPTLTLRQSPPTTALISHVQSRLSPRVLLLSRLSNLWQRESRDPWLLGCWVRDGSVIGVWCPDFCCAYACVESPPPASPPFTFLLSDKSLIRFDSVNMPLYRHRHQLHLKSLQQVHTLLRLQTSTSEIILTEFLNFVLIDFCNRLWSIFAIDCYRFLQSIGSFYGTDRLNGDNWFSTKVGRRWISRAASFLYNFSAIGLTVCLAMMDISLFNLFTD